MATFTISVYDLIKSGYDFGLDDYAIFDEDYRPILNNAILEFYKWYEIGYINPDKWRDRLNQRMDLIMRNKYNAMYEIKKTEFNPLYNIELHENFTHEVTNEEKVNEKQENSVNSKVLNSTFPNESMMETDIEDNVFVDGLSKQHDTENNKNETNTNGNTKETYTRTTQGSSAGLPFSKAMIQFQEYLKKYNLDQMVIDELRDLFMSVWE